ncbi:MAG: hypothetical protein P4L84_21860, partial [Isosphaeraceae bacterium]|nr:hypothetical protein [Isosphaeraceae bacterium]
MAEMTGRQGSRLEPVEAWTVLTDAPLKGLCLAREAGTIFAWDEGGQLYLLDLRGDHRSASRVPCNITAGAISDDGSLVVLLAEGGRVWFLSADLEVVAERAAPPDPLGLAIDPHGRYVVVGSRMNQAQIYNRYGRPAGKFETRQAVSFFTFVPDRPILLGAATFGLLAAYDIGRGGAGRLDVSEIWEERLMSNVGRLTTTGDGGMILASCFIHGVQRFDIQGQNEGAYHLGGTAAHAVPDFAGRMIAVGTLEGDLIILNSAGNVRWRNTLSRPALALETDPLGRYVIYGHATGEIVRLDLYAGDRERPAAPKAKSTPVSIAGASGAPGASVRKPAWSVPVADSADHAETAVLTVLDDPPRIAVFAAPGRLSLFTTEGKSLGRASELTGVGRILR